MSDRAEIAVVTTDTRQIAIYHPHLEHAIAGVFTAFQRLIAQYDSEDRSTWEPADALVYDLLMDAFAVLVSDDTGTVVDKYEI